MYRLHRAGVENVQTQKDRRGSEKARRDCGSYGDYNYQIVCITNELAEIESRRSEQKNRVKNLKESLRVLTQQYEVQVARDTKTSGRPCSFWLPDTACRKDVRDAKERLKKGMPDKGQTVALHEAERRVLEEEARFIQAKATEQGIIDGRCHNAADRLSKLRTDIQTMTETLDEQHEDCPYCNDHYQDALCTMDDELYYEIQKKHAAAETLDKACKLSA